MKVRWSKTPRPQNARTPKDPEYEAISNAKSLTLIARKKEVTGN
jgi:hypothetical protein